MDNPDQQDSLETAIITAQQLGLGIGSGTARDQLGAARADALVRVRYGDQEVLYAAEVKRRFVPRR